MIDPRALQQHFLKVNQRPEFKKAPIPRISEPKPLTAIQAIPVPVPIIEELVTTKLNEQHPTVVNNEPVNLVINVPPSIENLVVEEVEIDEPAETENEPIYENSVIADKEESYDPYGYYSGPRF